MGNISYVSSKTGLTDDRVADDLDEINERRFGGFFDVFVPHDGGWDVGFHVDGAHKSLWYFLLQPSSRKIGSKSPRPNYFWVEWAWCVFQAELAKKWGGRLSNEGVSGTWSADKQLDWCVDLPTYIRHRYSYMKDDDPGRQHSIDYAVEQTERTMPRELYRHAVPDPVEGMKDYVRETFAKLGAEICFEADDDLGSYRRGDRLTMGELRALEDGTVVWLYIYYKESVRADGAYRIERRDGCWVFDDGSSFGADLEDDGEDADPAGDEWTEVYGALKQ